VELLKSCTDFEGDSRLIETSIDGCGLGNFNLDLTDDTDETGETNAAFHIEIRMSPFSK